MIASFTGFGTLIAVIITSIVHAPPIFLAASMLTVYAIVLSVIVLEGRRRVPWLKPRLIPLTMASVKPIFGPGMGMNLISLGQGLSIQGTFLAVSYAISPRAGLIFSTTRTVARAGMQLTNMVEYSVRSEFSTALGASDFALAKRLHHRMAQLSFWIAIFATVGLAILGKPIFLLFTRNAHPRLPFQPGLFGLMLLALVVNGAYTGSVGAPTGVNKHLKMSIYYCIASAFSVATCWVACRLVGLAGAGIATLELEVIMMMIVVPIALRIVHDDPIEWAKAMVRPDFRWLVKRLLRRA
jgi:O-antigen/teichoic acid export membrane protein